jgi:hypothetical protein
MNGTAVAACHVKRTERGGTQETACISPNSTNFRVTDFRDSGKYANMINSKTQRMPESFTDHNVTESVNCPFHYTEGYKSIRIRKSKKLRGPEMHRYRLYGTGKLVAIVIEGT